MGVEGAERVWQRMHELSPLVLPPPSQEFVAAYPEAARWMREDGKRSDEAVISIGKQ